MHGHPEAQIASLPPIVDSASFNATAAKHAEVPTTRELGVASKDSHATKDFADAGILISGNITLIVVALVS